MKMTTREVLETAAAYIKEAIDQLPADLPEIPDIIEEWPEDDTHLRREFWEDMQGEFITYMGDRWMFWSEGRGQWLPLPISPGYYLPLTRATDPSLPRTWDTLDAVDTDVDRVTGDYAGIRRELARSPLCKSGWFQRLNVGPIRGWVELSADRAKHVTNIREEQ